MTRLLNASFARLFRGVLFYLCALSALALAVIETLVNFNNSNSGPFCPEAALFRASGVFFLVVAAVFTGIFIGAEHDGALRNKIIAGQKRSAVLFAGTITCCAAVAMIHFLFVAAVFILGFFLGGEPALSFGELAVYELLQLASLVGVCVLFSVVALLCRHKFGGAIISLVMVFAFLAYSVATDSILNSKKYSYEFIYEGVTMESVEKEDVSRSEQMQIAVLEGIRDITPTGQQQQITDSFYNVLYSHYDDISTENYTKVPPPAEVAPCALGAAALAAAVGALVFRKKDIK